MDERPHILIIEATSCQFHVTIIDGYNSSTTFLQHGQGNQQFQGANHGCNNLGKFNMKRAIASGAASLLTGWQTLRDVLTPRPREAEQPPSDSPQDETGVYENLLQETAHRAVLKLPFSTTVRSGPGGIPVFSCTVEFARMSFTGEPANTKKQAQKNTAMEFLLSLFTAACVKTGRPQITRWAIKLAERMLAKDRCARVL